MNIKEIIETLKMENDLIRFDPLTGAMKSVDELNELNGLCFYAHSNAIEILKLVEPLVEVVKK